jgi:zinc and cadmium transporter
MQAILFAALVGLANLLGGLMITFGLRRRAGTLDVLVAFGGGFMLAVALLEMLPNAVGTPGALTAVLVGYLAVHLTQHTLTPHFHFGEETHHDAMVSRRVGVWAFVGLVPHAFFDGVAIASGFLADRDLGLLIFAAVILHKIPTGVSLASIMLASGNSTVQTVAAVGVVSACTVLGALATPASSFLVRYGLALAAGVTVYVAASNLIPESQRVPGWRIPGAVFLGVLAFYLVRLLLPGGHA